MTVIQIGSNRGYDDFTSLIETKKIDLLILVEPFEEHNLSLGECYKHLENVYIENVIIVDDEKLTESIIYFHKEDTTHLNSYELASLNKYHSLKIRNHYKENDICERRLRSMTINQLLTKYNLRKIDILFVDTEGYDDKIIESLDFENFAIDEIYYENLHIDSFKLKLFLETKNYNITKSVGYGGWTDFAKIKK